MKQFQKYGVAAAVASVATGVVATEVSKNEAGDLAIIPYYTVLDGKNTGMHIINTTSSTQVVKVRLRRGADSKDALDFNLVMSPYDEWTANIGAGGPNGVRVTTNDTTCTVPEFAENGTVADMPPSFAEGATEGYVEIIAMAQPSLQDLEGEEIGEEQSLAVFAEHTEDGVPLSCALVREHFYRVAGTDFGDITVAGVHASGLSSGGYCTTANAATTGNACYNATALAAGLSAGDVAAANNLTFFGDSDDGALKVSWMVTDSAGGLEIGDNAVMVESFAELPMMTNQQPLAFTTAGELTYDPLNFELPNLAYGAWLSNTPGRSAASSITDGTMFDDVRAALNADAVINDWAAFSTDDGTVATDWVVTLPGQYIMNSPMCDFYGAYPNASTAMACVKASTASGGLGYTTATELDHDELPLIVSGPSVDNAYNDDDSNLVLWDREEQDQAPERETTNPGLGFSPAGEGTAASPRNYLLREVNVISFQDGDVLGSAALQDEDFGLRVVVSGMDATKGWGALEIQSDPLNGAPDRWTPDLEDDDAPIGVNTDEASDGDNWGGFTPVEDAEATMAVGFAAWERSFADQAGNYGRAIEHSTVSSRR